MYLLVYAVALLALPALAWFLSVGDIRDYFLPSVPTGQVFYIFSKLTGLLALSLITLQISLMVGRRVRFVRVSRRWNLSRHRWLGVATMLMVFAHVALFISATTLRAEHLTWHLLLPRFQSGFYDQMVSLGALGFFLILLIGWFGRFAYRSHARMLHRFFVAVMIVLVMVHSYAIGSESNSPIMLIYYVLLSLILVYSVFLFASGRSTQQSND